MNKRLSSTLGLAAILGLPLLGVSDIAEAQRAAVIEEVIVTAQRREESLQDAPISIAVLGPDQLAQQGIFGLADLEYGAIPSLKVRPFTNNPSTLVMSIRGIGEADPAQVTRELAVGIYLDGFYLGRAQGLGFDVADIERVEVLRGPQGTLYGRNAVGGAINLVSKGPEMDAFSFRQTFGVGNFSAFNALTHVNVPFTDRVAAKISFMHDERDGWVKNRGGEDFNAHSKQGGRAALRIEPLDNVSIDYVYDQSKIETVQGYNQFARIEEAAPGTPWIGNIPLEPKRQTRTRFPLPLEPSVTDVEGHSLTASWDFHADHTVRYLASYRSNEEITSTNYGGVFLVGLVVDAEVEQEQQTHELQILGTTLNEQLEYVAGIYYFEEDVDEFNENFGSLAVLDQNGVFFGPALPYNLFPLGGVTYPLGDARRVSGDAESRAVYSQLTYRPPVLENRLSATLGVRHTRDRKNAKRTLFNSAPDDKDESFRSSNTSPTVTLDYAWTDDISTYLRWANGYRAGGFNLRSSTFREYDVEEIETWELGWKMMLLGNQLRINGAVFTSRWEDAQIDFSDPTDITIAETINARRGSVEIDGFELDATWVPIPGLMLNVDYQYLDWNFPQQLNPLSGEFERFVLIYSPRHSAAANITYELPASQFGTLSFNLNTTYTGSAFFTPQNFDAWDSYTLVNGRVRLSDVPLGTDGWRFEVSVWGKNLTDKEWVTHSTQSQQSLSEMYGLPRTYGIDVTYRFR